MGEEAPRCELPEDLVADYLRRFQVAVRTMAPGSRDQAVRSVRRLLHEDLLATEPSAAEVHRYLQALGTPEQLREKADAAHGRRGSSAPLAIGGAILAPLFWPLGILFLWQSRYWTRTEKLIATLVVPGGVPAAFYLWPALLRVAVGAVWADAAETVMPLLSAAVAFYLVATFVLRVDDEALGIGARHKPR